MTQMRKILARGNLNQRWKGVEIRKKMLKVLPRRNFSEVFSRSFIVDSLEKFPICRVSPQSTLALGRNEFPLLRWQSFARDSRKARGEFNDDKKNRPQIDNFFLLLLPQIADTRPQKPFYSINFVLVSKIILIN
jgi:hypothetical protein